MKALLSMFLSTIAAAVGTDSIVVFSEIHYHPETAEAQQEFIELSNLMAVDVDLSGWRVSGGIDFTFPSGTVIPGRGYLVMASDPAALTAATGVGGVAGPWSGRLANNGERIRLRDRSDRIMDELTYGTGGQWPAGPDGSGASLAKAMAHGRSDDPAAWTTSWQVGGTPGSGNFPDPLAPFIPPSGLVSWWRMDEGAGATAGDATGRNQGTLGNGVSRVAGHVGPGALRFDGSAAASLNAGTGPSFTVTSGISLEAIIQPERSGTGLQVMLARDNPSVPTGLAAWYPFDEAATGTSPATDAAGGPAGIFSGAATRTAGSLGSTGAVRCTNAGIDGINIGSSPAFQTALTIAAWIKPTWSGNTGDYDQIFRKEDGGNRILFSFQRDSFNGSASPPVAAGPVLSLGLNTGGYRELDMPLDGQNGRPTLAQLKDGNWHHVAATYDSASGLKAIYVDGTLRHSTTHSGPFVTGGAAAAMIGNNSGGGEAFSGDIDDFALFRVALSAAQIASLASGSTAPLSVLPSTSHPSRILLGLQDKNGPALSFGLNTGGTYAELDLLLDGSQGRPSLAELTDGKPHHLAATYDAASGVKSIYLDGIEHASTVTSGPISAAGSAPVILGNLTPSGPAGFAGNLDEVAFWSRALSHEEVADHWKKVSAGRDYFAPAFTTTPPPTLELHEIGGPDAFFVELRNNGSASLDLTGCQIRLAGASELQFTFASGSLAPGALISLTAAQLGFQPSQGNSLFLLGPDGSPFIDGTEVATAPRGRTPEGSWANVREPSPGAANLFAFRDDLVISEIMYRPRPSAGQPATVRSHTLVPADASWKYRDDSTDPGPGWQEQGFPDASWTSGKGMFGSSAAAGAYAAAVGADAPQAWWRLDDAGPGMTDASGNGRHGTATAGSIRGFEPLVADGPASRAISLSGLNRITIPGFEKIGPGGYSVEYWVRVTTPPSGFLNLVGDGESISDFFLMNYLSPGGVVRPHYGFGNSPVSLDSSGTLSPGGTWHVVTTWDATSPTANGVIYLNGVADTTGTISRNLPAPGTTGNNALFIGYDNREPGSGSIVMDEVAIYNRALSADRVAAHYKAGASLPRSTTINPGTGAHYFRTTFSYGGSPEMTELFLRLAADDAAVVYLNGREIHRDNMPATRPVHSTAASGERSPATLSDPIPLPAASLRTGNNVLAVSIHQATGSNDVAFGLELTARETTATAVPASEDPNTWLELLNRGTSAADLTGWRLDGGVDFRFPDGTVVAPGARLVVASAPSLFSTAHPGIAVTGPITNRFSRRGERLLLRDAAGNIADTVHYYDSGRWPSEADGGGSSLELKDERSDNDSAESWAASDESSRSTWQTYRYRATASPDGGPINFNEFVIGLLDAGEVLIDDLVVTSQPDTANAAVIVTDGSFSSAAAAWRMRGTHRLSAVVPEPGNPSNKVLRVTSSGGTDVLHNCIETTLTGNAPIVNGRAYEIAFRARWLRGSRLLNTRLYWNRCARVTTLDVPLHGGSPGARNSQATANSAPSFRQLEHSPAVPAAAHPCTVSIAISDPDGIASASLLYSVNGSAFLTVPLTESHGLWSAAIPPQAAGAVVQFHARATDTAGNTADFPAAGPDSRALVQWNDGLANLPLAHNFRLILTQTDRARLFSGPELLADDFRRCTVIYDESEVFHDCGIRLKGSEHGRADPGRQSYHIRFPAEHPFRGVHDSVLLDRSGGWRFGRTTGQDEILVKHIITHAGGTASLYDDIVRLISPQQGHSGPALLQMARFGGDYLNSMYSDGADGLLYKMEIAYHTTATDNGSPAGNKLAQESSISNIDFGDRGTDPEAYRWFFRQENHPLRSDASAMIALNQAFASNGPAFDGAIDPLIDNGQWMRVLALESLCGISDIFSRDNGHNATFFVRPKDGRILLLPWDWDFSFVQAPTAPLWGNRQSARLVQRPHNLRRFYTHLDDILKTTFREDYLKPWVDHYDNFTPGQDFSSILTWIRQRAAHVQSQIPSPAPWSLTSAPAAEALVHDTAVTFTGTAPFSYRKIEFLITGTAAVSADFPALQEWKATVPILPGRQTIQMRVYDSAGLPMAAHSREFTVIGTALEGLTDNNANGLPDLWEAATGLAAETDATAAGDSDSDGFSNLAEYYAGTDPLSPASRLALAITAPQGNSWNASFPAAAGRTYRLETSDDPGAATWQTVQSIGPLTSDQSVPLTLNPQPGFPRFFVRIATP